MAQNIHISPVERTHSPLRYLWPIQSPSQFVTMVLTYVAVLGVIALVLHFAETAPWLSRPHVLLCSGAGATWAMFSVLPARVKLTTRGEARHFTDDIAQLITAHSYTLVPANGAWRFVQKGPRWLRVRESEIMMTVEGNTIQLHGPVVLLRIIRRRLANYVGRQCAVD